MSYIIGSYNLRDFNFSNKSTDGTNEELKRDFNKIASIIIEENFDVLALQEINSELPLKHLTYILNSHKNYRCEYDYAFGIDMPHLTFSKDPERYGFIWNTKRLRLLKVSRGSNPGHYQNAGALGLIRPPYYARFTARGLPGGSNFELRLVNTHIKDASQQNLRIEEFNILVRQILPRICDHQNVSADGEIMPAYTFLMGDYNLALNKSDRSIYRIETVTNTTYTGRSRNFITVQEEPSSLKLPKNQTVIKDCYANNYDHFTYDVDLNRKLVLTPQRVEVLSKYLSEALQAHEKLTEYRKKVSDHVPIKLIVDLK